MGNEGEWCIAVQSTGVIAEATQLDLHIPERDVEKSQLSDATFGIQLIAAGSARMQVRVRGTGCTFAKGYVVQHQLDPFRRTRLKAIQAGYILGATSSVKEHVSWHLDVALAFLENSRAEWRHGILSAPSRPGFASLFRVHELVV